MILMLLPGSGGDGGSGSGTGTMALDIAHTRLFIAGAQPEAVWLLFDELIVHKSGGSWVPLDLFETPFKINWLAFSDGLKTEFVTPTVVPACHITQIRFVIERPYMVFCGDADPTGVDLGVPSGVLRTDKQCECGGGNLDGALRCTVHFDLSQSIVETGVGEYKLKRVLHLFDNTPQETATICGSTAASGFVSGDPPEDVIITVIWNRGDETYTKVTVTRQPETDPIEFCIFWVVPHESYTVQIDNGFDTLEEPVVYTELSPGETFYLNDGAATGIPKPAS